MSGENCKDCPYIKTITENVKQMQGTVSDHGERINQLERKVDVDHERTNQLYKILDEIKNTIAGISEKLDTGIGAMAKELQDIRLAPAKKYDALIMAAATTTIGGLIGFVLSKLLG
jgi:gas vesicle protein